MIPVSPLGILLGTLLLCISYGCIGGVLFLLAGLCIPRARRFMRHYWLRFAVLGVAMALGSLPLIKMVSGVVARTQAQERLERLRDVELAREEVVGDIQLPAGSRLRLARPEVDPSAAHLPYGLASVEEAQFAPAARIRGLLATRLELKESPWPDSGDQLPVQGRLHLAEAQQVEGWPCAASEPVSFEYLPSQRLHPDRWRLDSCRLQDNSHIAGARWPQGVRLSRWGDAWALHSAGHWSNSLEHAGLRLGRLNMTLREDRSIRDWSGHLAQTMELGGIGYAEGAEIKSSRKGYLLLGSDTAVELRTGQALIPRQYVLHRADGGVVDIYSAEQAVRIDWDDLP